jgi:hypothetical protein
VLQPVRKERELAAVIEEIVRDRESGLIRRLPLLELFDPPLSPFPIPMSA